MACHCISVLALGRWDCLMSEAWGCMCVRVIMAAAADEDWVGWICQFGV